MEHAFGLSIRPAVTGDYVHFARLFLELAVDDPVPSEAVWNEVLRSQIIFAELDKTPVGYGLCEVHKNVGYVRNLAVDALHRRRGIGRKLMEAMAERLRLAGCTSWRLNVRIENVPAQRLYEALGFAQAYRSTAVRIRWDAIAALPGGGRPFGAHIIHPNDDPHLEAQFDIAPGQLAKHRAREGQVLLRIVERSSGAVQALGIASFAPSFPGAFPFRLADSAATKALLEAMRPYARPSDAEVSVVLEDDEKTTALLVNAGATVKAELFHYRGLIPAGIGRL